MRMIELSNEHLEPEALKHKPFTVFSNRTLHITDLTLLPMIKS
jgi:hypothetical protein